MAGNFFTQRWFLPSKNGWTNQDVDDNDVRGWISSSYVLLQASFKWKFNPRLVKRSLVGCMKKKHMKPGPFFAWFVCSCYGFITTILWSFHVCFFWFYFNYLLLSFFCCRSISDSDFRSDQVLDSRNTRTTIRIDSMWCENGRDTFLYFWIHVW